MSVLQRKELENSPLADLHAIASELGIEGYRGLRRDDLIAGILKIQGGDDDRPSEPEGEVEDRAEEEQAEDEVTAGSPAEEAESRDNGTSEKATSADADEQHEAASGTLDVLPNGSGFLRRYEGPDVYVSPAQIKRCELRPGDEVAGPMRSPRRNERHPSLVRVETVNGRDADPPEQRSDFSDLTPVYPRERLACPGLSTEAPFGRGSRVAVSGPSGAGASRVLREVATALKSDGGDLGLAVVLVGARPEEVTDWRGDAGVPVSGGSFDQAPDEQAQAATLAVERGKRVAERGGDAVVVIDSLAGLDPLLARKLLGAGRKLEEGGSLTIVAAVGESSELLRVASTRIVLEGGASKPRVVADRSGTQRADLLG